MQPTVRAATEADVAAIEDLLRGAALPSLVIM